MRDKGTVPAPTLEQAIAVADWAASPLGPPAGWSPALHTVFELMLRAQAEIVLFWGPEFVALYNDAYSPTIGEKHPGALGRPAREHWAELWDDLEPLLSGVRGNGETFAAKDRAFYIERHGYGETVYFDVSYSAVPEADGSIGGVLCIVSETTERVLAERRVAASERRFRALVNATADTVYRMNADWSSLIELQGKDILVDVAEPSSDWVGQFVPPDERETVAAAVRRAIDHDVPFESEHRVYLKTGEIGWLQSRAVPIRDERGAIVEWFGAASDVTHEHRQRERLEVMVHELDHRVKNTLAMVQAIAQQTFRRSVDPAEAQATFEQRLKAISDANALLTGDRRVRASLVGAIEQAVGAHVPVGDDLALAGADLVLTPKTALAISLAMHELATNAVRFGAWSVPGGQVTIEWTQAPGDGIVDLALEWRERGGPPVAAPVRRGFGSRLIERGLAGELDGEVRLWFDPAGLRCTMRARLPLAGDEA